MSLLHECCLLSRGRGRERERDLPFDVPYPSLPQEQLQQQKKEKSEKTSKKPSSPSSSSPPEPVYSVKYRGEVAMEDFTNNRVSPVVKRPKEIVVTVQLPGLVSTSCQWYSEPSDNELPHQ